MHAFLLVIVVTILLQVRVSGKDAKKLIKANKKDIQYIQCSVCENTFRELRNKVYKLHNTKPPTYVSEMKISQVVDDICNVNEESWIRKVDIISYNPNNDTNVSGLKLVYQGGDISRCEVECKTIQESCTKLVDDEVDREHLVSYIQKQINKNHTVRGSTKNKKFEAMVCNEWLKVCPAKNLTAGYERADLIFKDIVMTPTEVNQENSRRVDTAFNVARKEGVLATFELAEDMRGSRVSLFWDKTYKGELSHTNPAKHKTYYAHHWHAKINDKIVKTWTMGSDPVQVYSLSWNEVFDNDKEL